MTKHIENTGFAPPHGRKLGREHRTVAIAELLATAALAFSTLAVVTVLTVGIAHADVAVNAIDNEGSVLAMALVLGLLFVGMGGLTVLTLPGEKARKHKT